MTTELDRIVTVAEASGHPAVIAAFLRTAQDIAHSGAIHLTLGDHIWTGAWADLADEIERKVTRNDIQRVA